MSLPGRCVGCGVAVVWIAGAWHDDGLPHVCPVPRKNVDIRLDRWQFVDCCSVSDPDNEGVQAPTIEVRA